MEGFPRIQEEDKTGVDEWFKVFAAVDFPKLERTKGKWPAVPPLRQPSSGLCPADYFGRRRPYHRKLSRGREVPFARMNGIYHSS
jgi:hypothetical protein